MITYTIDVLLIALIIVLLIQIIKAPIKNVLTKNNRLDTQQAKNVFKVICVSVSMIVGFGASCIYFWMFEHINPFADITILWYTIGTVGASQTIYVLLETYGRDGLLVIIKNVIIRHKEKTNLIELSKNNDLAEKIVNGLKQIYSDSPVTQEEIAKIIKQNK